MSVYKYVHPKRTDIFTNAMIRFTQAAYFNDPFEMKPYIHSLASDRLLNNLSSTLINDPTELQNLIENAMDVRLSEADPQQLVKGLSLDLFQYHSWLNPQSSVQDIQHFVQKELSAIIVDNSIDGDAVKKFYKTAFLKLLDSDPQNYVNLTQYLSSHLIEMFNLMHPGVITNLQQIFIYQIGVLSLSKTAPVGKEDESKNIVMWAHYTDNHKGFVLEFDESHSFFNQRLNDHDMMRHLHPVQYLIERPNITLLETDTGELDNEKLTNHFMVNFFYTKSVAWRYEQEVRMLLPLEGGKKVLTDEEDIYLFPFPPECLKGVYLGYKIQPESRRTTIRILRNDSRYNQVKLYQTAPDEKEFFLNAQLLD